MSELQQLPDMTLEEAQAKHAQLKSLESVMRSNLLEMRDRKGWKVLGYESFSDYGEKEWGFSQSYISRLTNAAAIQEKLNMPIGIKEIPESTLRPLNQVPDDIKKQIWDEVTAENERVTAAKVQEAVNEWKAKHEAAQKRIDWLEDDKKAIHQQNDELRNQLAFKVDEQVQAKLADERAKLILENQQAIAENKRLAENAQHELERLKREQEKAISDGVTLELNKLTTEMNQKRYQIECYERDLNDLKKVKSELDAEVGALAVHKQAIKEIKNHLSFLTTSFADAFDTNVIPAEVAGEWDAIYFAISKLKKQMSEWRDSKSPIESEALIGELVN